MEMEQIQKIVGLLLYMIYFKNIISKFKIQWHCLINMFNQTEHREEVYITKYYFWKIPYKYKVHIRRCTCNKIFYEN